MLKIVKCGRFIDGTGARAIENAIIVVEGSKIQNIGEEGAVDLPTGKGIEELDCSGLTVLPGLIDSHMHLAIGAGSFYEEMFAHTDAHLLMTGVINARSTLDAGITTVRDLGTRNKVAFELRDASNRGLIKTPRLLLAGRSITMTGGHFYFCNAVADGYEEVRKTARGLLEEGADFIKVMASGGGTRITNPRLPSYSVEELRGATEVAHRAGKTATVHCHATEAILNAIEAGFDFIEHCSFYESVGEPPGYNFREDVAREIAKAGIIVGHVFSLRPNHHALENRFELFEGISKAGVEIIAATDDLFLDLMGRLPFVLELMVRGGTTPMEAIQSATMKPAKALGLDDLIGTLEQGKEADIIAVRGNPLEDITTLATVEMVMKGGEVVPPSPRSRGVKENVAVQIKQIREVIEEHELGHPL